MTKEKFKESLFKKLIAKKEFVEEDREKFNSDFNEFDDTWDIMLEIINEAIEEEKDNWDNAQLEAE